MRCCPISEPTFLTLWKVRSLSKAHVRDVIFNGFYLLDGNEFFLFFFSFITRSGLKEFSIFTKWLENGFAWELAFKIHYIFPTRHCTCICDRFWTSTWWWVMEGTFYTMSKCYSLLNLDKAIIKNSACSILFFLAHFCKFQNIIQLDCRYVLQWWIQFFQQTCNI